MVKKPVILVVDDDVPILTLMLNLLKEFGFEPITANSGDEAMRAAREKQPALVLLDKNMPGMHGTEVARALRAENEKLKILILSGDPVEPDELEELGANGAVQKPFDVLALVNKIKHHLGEVA